MFRIKSDTLQFLFPLSHIIRGFKRRRKVYLPVYCFLISRCCRISYFIISFLFREFHLAIHLRQVCWWYILLIFLHPFIPEGYFHWMYDSGFTVILFQPLSLGLHSFWWDICSSYCLQLSDLIMVCLAWISLSLFLWVH